MTATLSLLIVEENASMCVMLERFFRRLQVDVHSVSSVAEARAVLAQRPCHVVLSALFPPYRDGLTLARHIHATLPQTRVIIMSTFGSLDDYRAAQEAGVFACIDIPFRLEHLWKVVQRALPDARVTET